MWKKVFPAVAIASLLAGLWAGVLRAGAPLPPWQPNWIYLHGPLMVCAFLGTLVGFERAVSLNRLWTYAAPGLGLCGAVVFLLGFQIQYGQLLFIASSLGLIAIYVYILSLQLTVFHLITLAGAVSWCVGNCLWWRGLPLFNAVPWWLAFLVFTIAGERLELNRLLKHSKTVLSLFFAALCLLFAGAAASVFSFPQGMKITGASLAAVALWLSRWDIARFTIKRDGLPRFIAACLLSGYAWLALGGALMMIHGGAPAGFHYDAMLHCVFAGFVLSMIFGHAPIILSVVFHKTIGYSPWFYSHLALLHLSLAYRVGGDLMFSAQGYRWGAFVNACAVLLFMLNTGASLLIKPASAAPSASGQAV